MYTREPEGWDDCSWIFKPKKYGKHNTCLCGLRRSEGHDEFCPFPYYGDIENTINLWEIMREKTVEIEHRCEQACKEHDIQGRITTEEKQESARTRGINRKAYHAAQQRIFKKKAKELERNLYTVEEMEK